MRAEKGEAVKVNTQTAKQTQVPVEFRERLPEYTAAKLCPTRVMCSNLAAAIIHSLREDVLASPGVKERPRTAR